MRSGRAKNAGKSKKEKGKVPNSLQHRFSNAFKFKENVRGLPLAISGEHERPLATFGFCERKKKQKSIAQAK